jgi:outer membrane biosynthesis protein TonB
VISLCIIVFGAAIFGAWFYPQIANPSNESPDTMLVQVEQTLAALQLTAAAAAASPTPTPFDGISPLDYTQTAIAEGVSEPSTAVPPTPTTQAAVVAPSPTPTTQAVSAPPSPTLTDEPVQEPTSTTRVVPPTHTPTPTTVPPTQLTKTNWQVDFAFIGGSKRLQVSFTQNGSVLSGSNRDNQAEVDIVTTGTVTGSTMVVTFTMTNGGNDRGTVTCTVPISGSPPFEGTFTAPAKLGVGATSGNCNFR